MCAEFLREMAVLLSVLYPLEAGINGNFRWDVFVAVEVLSGTALYLGMMLEDGES